MKKYKLTVLENGKPSPLKNHGPMDFAYEKVNDSYSFFVYEMFVVIYGMNAVEKGIKHFLKG